jgi:hypothetical protein
MPKTGQVKLKSAKQSAKASLMPKGSTTVTPLSGPSTLPVPIMEADFVERAFVKEATVIKVAKSSVIPSSRPTGVTPGPTPTKSPASPIGIVAQTPLTLLPALPGPVGPAGPVGPLGKIPLVTKFVSS